MYLKQKNKDGGPSWKRLYVQPRENGRQPILVHPLEKMLFRQSVNYGSV